MASASPFEAFDLIVRSVLPASGGSLVALSNIYFDESGTHDGSPLMSMAGYWFDQKQAARFSRDWARDLAEFGLSHAHMTDCALGFGEYAALPKPQRVKVQKRLIEHIKRRSRFGFGVCMSPIAYDDAMRGLKGAPSAYTTCLMILMNKVAEFANAVRYDGKIAYFFESGHAKANEAHKFIDHIPVMGQPMVEHHRYASHTFVDKRIALPLQAADMFAWHLRHYWHRRMQGYTEPRKDYVALHRPFDFQTMIGHRHILGLRDTFLYLGPLIEQGRFEEAAGVEAEIVQKWGLPQMPVWVPKHTPTGKGPTSDKPVVRF